MKTKMLFLCLFAVLASWTQAEEDDRDDKTKLASKRLEMILDKAKAAMTKYETHEAKASVGSVELELKKKLAIASRDCDANLAINAMLLSKIGSMKEKMNKNESQPQKLVYETSWCLFRYCTGDVQMTLPSCIIKMLKESSEDEFKVMLAAFETSP